MKKLLSRTRASGVALFLLLSGVVAPAHASFHLMQIEQAIGGVNGDTSAQAIQLRLRGAGQSIVSQARLVAYDAAGANPIVLKDFTTNVSNNAAGARILIASAGFSNYTSAPLTPDFTLTNLIPASYLAAGRLTFESDSGTILWSLSFGGAAYTGATTGAVTNDADGNFGPSFAGPLPSSGLSALQFQGAANAPSTNNAANYALTSGAATFTNNAGGSATLTTPAPPSLSVNNPRSLPEGSAAASGSVTFDVELSAASAQSVTVNFQTVNGINNPATAGVDYTAKSGKLTFLAGEVLKRVTINFIGDSTVELNETFFFDLLTPTNATIADNRGVGQINNDDGPGITVSNAVTLNEGDGGTKDQIFVVTLSEASPNTVTVAWMTADKTAGPADYVADFGTLTFAPGQTSQNITVRINGDTTVEPNETYKVILSKPTLAFVTDALGIGTIRNDDAAALLFEDDEPSR